MKKKYLVKTKFGAFYVNIWLDKRDKVYIAEVPAFRGVLTQGNTMADAKRMATDLIELLSEETLSRGNAIVDDEKHLHARGKVAQHIGPVRITTA